ncbi:MAG: hypothetical protein SV186_01480 [Candidatus Nanohaloarchaea archaeon]|nr:hypothetical protein [Candidatus Nanohaloarchaea archaeon]
MLRRLTYTAVLAGVAAGVHVLGWSYDIPYARQLVLTFASLAVLYGFFKLVVEEVFVQRIEQSKTRYVFRKANSVLYIAAFLVGVGRIWIADPQTLLVAYSIVGAGVAAGLLQELRRRVDAPGLWDVPDRRPDRG